MPVFENADVSIHYEVSGHGFPLTLFAPGGMHSVIEMWRENPSAPGKPMPWIDPTVALAEDFRVIAMDQRNAGTSSAPVAGTDGWPSFADDQAALLRHLDVSRTHLMGGCIGSSYCLGFIQANPGRVAAAVLQNPIGLTADNRGDFIAMFDGWAKELETRRPEVTRAALDRFRDNMFGGDFVFSVDREFVRSCPVPLLVFSGDDNFHPRQVAEEIVDLAPTAELVVEWKGTERYVEVGGRILEFLRSHTPQS